jgi:hypothetical protein
MRYSKSKEIELYVRRLIADGWTYYRGAKHGRVTSPDGKRTFTVPGTPSDWRVSRNFINDLKRFSKKLSTGILVCRS